MNHRQIAKHMIIFNKMAFDNNFHAMKVLQEQAENIVNKFWEKSPLFPAEGKQIIAAWLQACKRGNEDFKRSMDDSFQKVEKFFNETK